MFSPPSRLADFDTLALAWLLTYLIHSTLLLTVAAAVARWLSERSVAWGQLVWRGALFGGLLTASLQVAFDLAPRAGRLELQSAASSSDRHPTDLAGLMGARLVTSTETEEGRRWAESKLKQLTGGDVISARFMRGDFFDFLPAFKLVIAGNHKPGLRSVDEAIRRRLHLIPFSVVIPEAERDATLTARLRAEWPGILRWAVDGCLEWQRQGLNPPAAVRDATAAYIEAEDATAAWIEERCERKADAWTPSADLYASWKTWADGTGEFVGTVKRFGQTLESRGLLPRRDRTQGRGFLGVKLRPTTADYRQASRGDFG